MIIKKYNILEVGRAEKNADGSWNLSGWKVDVYDFRDGADVTPWRCVPSCSVDASGSFYGWPPARLAEIAQAHGK